MLEYVKLRLGKCLPGPAVPVRYVPYSIIIPYHREEEEGWGDGGGKLKVFANPSRLWHHRSLPSWQL